MPLMNDKEAVLAMINGVRNEFTDVVALSCDKQPQYIAFEAVSKEDHLNEGKCTRGSNCTSVDALVMAKRGKETVLIPIEWKYTEAYINFDKSTEGEGKRKGLERQRRYNQLITASKQLKSKEIYERSIYYQEPFYQLMRQTLWAEKVVEYKSSEILKADDYWHIHVIPSGNKTLLDKKYNVSGLGMEETWRGCLNDNAKYQLVDPSVLLATLQTFGKYKDLMNYLKLRYW